MGSKHIDNSEAARRLMLAAFHYESHKGEVRALDAATAYKCRNAYHANRDIFAAICAAHDPYAEAYKQAELLQDKLHVYSVASKARKDERAEPVPNPVPASPTQTELQWEDDNPYVMLKAIYELLTEIKKMLL